MIRFIHICFVLIKYGFLFLLLKIGIYKKPPGNFIRQFFEEAGGSFIKFGQLLALRVDVLPKEYSLEMLDLLDNVKPFAYSYVKEIFLSDLGAAPEKIFKDFQKKPFASGSFGQVHAAKLEDGTIVAVKIMRPGIEEAIKTDFLIITFLALLAEVFFKISGISWKEFAEEFKSWTLKELDYLVEADNAELLYRNKAPDSPFVIPQIHHRLSTRRILVQDYIDGYPLSRVLRGLKDGRLTYEMLLELDVDIKKIPRVITSGLLEQFLFHGFFHADLHPGNVIILPGGKIGLIDFGIMGKWIPDNQLSFVRFLRSIGNFSFKESTYHFSNLVSDDLKQMIQSAFPASIDQENIDSFIRVLTDHFSESVEKTIRGSLGDLKEMKKDYTVLLFEILNSAQSYKIQVPSEMAIFVKALSTLSLVAKELDKEFYIHKELKKFFDKYKDEDFPISNSRSPYKRMSRERALERLSNWLSYLIEADPVLYKVVNSYITKYNVVDT